MIIILSITKEESEYIREHNPEIQQVVINKHAPSRKKSWLVTDEGATRRLLKQFRRERVHVTYSSYWKKKEK